MSHGQPLLSGDFFAFNSQGGNDGGPSVMSNDHGAAAVATMAAQLQHQQQHQQQVQQQQLQQHLQQHQQQHQQQQQANDDAMMMFLNEPPADFFDSFDDMPTDLAPQQPGTMFPPPPPPPQSLPQQPASSLALSFGSTGVVSHGGNINSHNLQINSNATDDSPSGDTDDANGSVIAGGANEPGGGPLPVDNFTSGGPNSAAGAGGAGAAGSALTEFTRRKNWPAKVVEELTDLLQIIEPNGRIRYASPNVVSILGYTPEEVAGRSFTEMAHPDDRSVLISDLNACIANASMLRMYVRLRKKDGNYAIVEMVGHAHIAASRFAPNPSNKSAFCQAVFLMSRSYPTKNANLLDSFLEHKMENERLRRRIDDLRREEESEDRDDESHAQSQSWVWRQSMDTRSDLTSAAGAGAPDAATMATAAAAAMGSAMASQAGNNAGTQGAGGNPAYGANNNNNNSSSMSMPPPRTPLKLNLGNLGGAGSMMPGGGPNNAALTRENLEGITARRADSLGDKMARYEGAPGTGNTNTTTTTTTNTGTSGILSTAAALGSMVTADPTSVGGGLPSTGGKRVTIAPPAGAAGANAASTLPMSCTADTIEMLTGLRYQEGERSRGLSTGNRSPRLVKGDAGIAFSVNRDQRTGDKKKKARLAEEYVCTDCGTLESPEWRKGPSGPKTLCNACGLRWAKKEKREKKKAAASAGVLGFGVTGSANPVGAPGGGSPPRLEE